MSNQLIYKTWFPVKPDWYQAYYQDILQPEFIQWCIAHGVKLKQFHVDYGFKIPNEDVHVLFMLRWGWISAEDEDESYTETHQSLYERDYRF